MLLKVGSRDGFTVQAISLSPELYFLFISFHFLGGHDRSVLIGDYERRMDVWRRRRVYQQKLFQRFREIDNDQSIAYNRKGLAPEQYKLLLVKDALSW